ncbi:Fic family protein [Duganella radicis]|uniref:protein adenylyltransferase n=1 Tax=Duganella radicis TaxID=551988 RepID=A0A6L6PHD2_9BURK|nr:Fic family protein [Duganella radicis]MTV37705.1 cell filamentation protein [Duganella radicis]
MTFDPFGDYDTNGYLRNYGNLKDREFVKIQEHSAFVSNLDEALDFLSPANSPEITYQSFLDVHRILFSDFYPWAGQDRLSLGVGRNVGKGDAVEFEQSDRSRQAVEWGLHLAAKGLRQKPGAVMGAFAWAHPFLDGNGRTMLLVHTELCGRAGFAIDWTKSGKNAYLDALTKELWRPDKGLLDGYFVPLIYEVSPREDWRQRILHIQGIDGAHSPELNIAYHSDDPNGPARYDEIRRARGEDL